ncbi:MAG: xanthine dehydrogenase family protein subunit M [Moraxellaceae bacterium]|nr:MAG: xanthine dehydrogenase family protein subunit M [Moraxellaceae bacterium]
MKTFAYFRAQTLEQAPHLLATQLANHSENHLADYLADHNNSDHLEISNSAKYIAGGTNLLDLMKLQIETPIALVDISRLPLTDVEETAEGGLKIGAMVSNSDLAAHPLIRERYAVLSRALLAGASGQLRNKASTGGNLLQRTRCYYFYSPTSPCNKRIPGSGCPAREGHNRMHAILGVSEHCIAQHPSDMAVAMQALDAYIETQRADGTTRRIALADFYLLPKDHPECETVLETGELITHVILPPAPTGHHAYRKVRDRASYAFALVSVAAVIDASAGQIHSARLAFGGIGVMPWRNRDVEQLLCSQPASSQLFNQAADLLLKDAQGSGENDFKIVLTRRVLLSVLNDACKGELQ